MSTVAQVDFYRERRLRPMLKYANDSEMSRLGDVLMRNLDSLFQGIEVGTRLPADAKLCQPCVRCHTAQRWHDTVSGMLHRSSRLCCMATSGQATSDLRTDSPLFTTLQYTTAITRYPSMSHALQMMNELCSTDYTMMTWCSVNATFNYLRIDHQCCASFCACRLSSACPGALALAAHSGQLTTNSSRGQKVNKAVELLASFLVICAFWAFNMCSVDAAAHMCCHVGFEERAKLYRFYHLANHYVRMPHVQQSTYQEWPAEWSSLLLQRII